MSILTEAAKIKKYNGIYNMNLRDEGPAGGLNCIQNILQAGKIIRYHNKHLNP